MIRILAAAALALALTACASAGTPAEARLAAACRAYAATLSTLAAIKPEMTVAQIAAVDRAVAVVGPTCREAEYVHDVPAALIAVSGALRALAAIEQEAKR